MSTPTDPERRLRFVTELVLREKNRSREDTSAASGGNSIAPNVCYVDAGAIVGVGSVVSEQAVHDSLIRYCSRSSLQIRKVTDL